jgi:hypothetical protein
VNEIQFFFTKKEKSKKLLYHDKYRCKLVAGSVLKGYVTPIYKVEGDDINEKTTADIEGCRIYK